MRAGRAFPPDFFLQSAEVVARGLLGATLVRELPDGEVRARLVETEAYAGAHDRASHAFRGRRTPRNESMYLPGGHAYVYRIYGIHFCLNVVTGEADAGVAVLLRAAEILEGEELVRRARSAEPDVARLLAGPGNLCRGLAVDKQLDGHPLERRPLRLEAGRTAAAEEILHGPRVGCESAGEAASWPLRFALAGSPAVSRPRRSLSAFRPGYAPPAGASRP